MAMRCEPLSQRVLAVVLRTEIDRARRGQDPQAERRAMELVARHPHGLRSTYIRHNVGRRRLTWLARRTRAGLCQVDATQTARWRDFWAEYGGSSSHGEETKEPPSPR